MNQFIQSIFFQKELHKRTIHVAFPKKINLGEIGNCFVKLPSPPEQQKIAAFLSTIDRQINLASQQLERMQTFKKGLLQQMFV
jgi:type I restriction enzyme S subunit